MKITSPHGKLTANIYIEADIRYEVFYNQQSIFTSVPLKMHIHQQIIGQQPQLKKEQKQTVKQTIAMELYGLENDVIEHYNELRLTFKDNYSITFRIFDNGVAYRWETQFNENITVYKEEIGYTFQQAETLHFGKVSNQNFVNSQEESYPLTRFDAIEKGTFALAPAVINCNNGVKVAITEADLLDYAGLFWEKGAGNTLLAKFPYYPAEEKRGGHNDFNLLVTQRKDYIAQTKGTRTFPWRIAMIAEKDIDLLHNRLVYLLATPAKDDFSWVKTGKVVWDWWHDQNLSGVPFKTGCNNETYKYYIDFAARNGIPYVNIDDGWSEWFDLMQQKPAINVPMLAQYAKERNVKLILWCVWHTLDRQMTEALDQFAAWGIAGLKIDFMDRDDQKVVQFYERTLQEAAKRKLVVNFHGAYKPTGLYRTYPNLVNNEGVLGMEYCKFSERITPQHNVTIPFTRMIVGAMDYTAGAMNNAAKGQFKQIFSKPMSPGTRCHQLAMLVVYHSPLQMLSDAPTEYEKEPIILDFMAKCPTVWEKSIAIDGKIGEFIIMAKQKNNEWYVAGMNGETPRKAFVKLDFLPDGFFEAHIFQDGINADRNGTDYAYRKIGVDKYTELNFDMAWGGGFVVKILKK
jgi:alpha-glucosidase